MTFDRVKGKRKIPKNECFVCKSKEVDDRGWTVHKPKCMYYGDPWGIESRYTKEEWEIEQREYIRFRKKKSS